MQYNIKGSTQTKFSKNQLKNSPKLVATMPYKVDKEYYENILKSGNLGFDALDELAKEVHQFEASTIEEASLHDN